MKRRDFLKKAGVGAVAASAVFGSVYAQALPRLRWRLSAGWPRGLDILFGPRSGAEYVARRIGELTEGRFEVSAHPAGELVPTPQMLDAVMRGGVEMGHGHAGWYSGISPVIALDGGSMPMGLNTRQQNSWLLFGGGMELMRRVYADLNLINFIVGNTSIQMGGWFRREIRALEDLRGLRLRVAGIPGKVYSRLGVTTLLIPPGEIFMALERGVIDTAEFVGPYDDERLGLHRAARFYYYPGWHESNGQITLWVNLERWRTLPRPYQEAIAAACSEANERMVAEYDFRNPPAMERLVRHGTQFRRFPTSVLQAASRASTELLEELAAADATFRAVYTPWLAFKNRSRPWFATNEFAYEDFVRTLRPA